MTDIRRLYQRPKNKYWAIMGFVSILCVSISALVAMTIFGITRLYPLVLAVACTYLLALWAGKNRKSASAAQEIPRLLLLNAVVLACLVIFL
ncbi:MAG: hypothetical protein KGH49_02170 [Candidatus Micrarchaeota archaeon]|nr:hypothetical protein [Candidatus Micrarchaeota archaeon]